MTVVWVALVFFDWNKFEYFQNNNYPHMVKHNNVVPNVHLRKHWQRNVTVWLNQASRKRRRLIARREKAALAAPRPTDSLRPLVHGQTIRYNNKTREGRGTNRILL